LNVCKKFLYFKPNLTIDTLLILTSIFHRLLLLCFPIEVFYFAGTPSIALEPFTSRLTILTKLFRKIFFSVVILLRVITLVRCAPASFYSNRNDSSVLVRTYDAQKREDNKRRIEKFI
jgi:hypothetical protein